MEHRKRCFKCGDLYPSEDIRLDHYRMIRGGSRPQYICDECHMDPDETEDQPLDEWGCEIPDYEDPEDEDPKEEPE